MRFMAVDQYGQTFHGLERPRRDLLRRLGRKHAAKMYRDRPVKGGARPVIHVGYVIGGLWLTLFEVKPWERPA
jgi:hypothetical protein